MLHLAIGIGLVLGLAVGLLAAVTESDFLMAVCGWVRTTRNSVHECGQDGDYPARDGGDF